MDSRFFGGAFATAVFLAGCSNSNQAPLRPAVPTTAPTTAPTAAPSTAPTTSPTGAPTATPSPNATPQVVHVGFTHATSNDPTFGEIAFYSNGSGPAAIINAKAGSKVVFLNDGSGVPHTASGLGSTGFPASFDNSNGPNPAGNTIDGGTTWSSGNLDPGATSGVFTVGPPGIYYFGCAYHYPFSPSMRDVIVSRNRLASNPSERRAGAFSPGATLIPSPRFADKSQ